MRRLVLCALVLIAALTCSCSNPRSKAERLIAGKWVDVENDKESLEFGNDSCRYDNALYLSGPRRLDNYSVSKDGNEIRFLLLPHLIHDESNIGVRVSPDLSRSWIIMSGKDVDRKEIQLIFPPWVQGVPLPVLEKGELMEFRASLAVTADELSLTVTGGNTVKILKTDEAQTFNVTQKTYKYRRAR